MLKTFILTIKLMGLRMQIFLLSTLVLILVFKFGVAQETVGTVWPHPQEVLTSASYYTIDPSNFKFAIKGGDCDILIEAIKRYKNITFVSGCSALSEGKEFSCMTQNTGNFHHEPLSLGEIKNLIIQYVNCEKYPSMNMDEQYELFVNSIGFPGSAVLVSNSAWGALRGLETFSQLVYQLESGQFVINSTSIRDFPRFSYRGVLLDTSRHYFSVAKIFENLDLMAQSKFNVFHWHIVDDPSFPYVSKSFPNLHKKGAFNPVTHIYSQKDVADVIEYARLRGIRVLVEFDSPGHTQSWGKGQDSLLTSCYNGGKPIKDSYGPVDPTNDTNYAFLKTLFTEIAATFPDDYIHLGGDEVDFSCWKSNPYILKFMEKQKFGKDFSLLEQYYIQRLIDSLQSLKKNYIVWQEVYDNKVKINQDTIIHVWKGGFENELVNVTKDGYHAILSSCWYLNIIAYGIDWHPYYLCDPQKFNGTDKQKDLVIGGEACMWSEFVDGSNFVARTWPRASVVAERLWSDKSLNSTTEATPRLKEHRCKLLKRGYRVENIDGPGFCPCDNKL